MDKIVNNSQTLTEEPEQADAETLVEEVEVEMEEAESVDVEAVEEVELEELEMESTTSSVEHKTEKSSNQYNHNEKAVALQKASGLGGATINKNGKSTTPLEITEEKAKAKIEIPAKEKELSLEKNAHKLALNLAKAKADMEARLFQLYQQLGVDPNPENSLVIGISSSLRGEGRTTVALAMATILARTVPFPVLLIESDISQDSSFRHEEQTSVNNLCGYLRGEVSKENLPQATNLNDLWIIPAGDSNNQPLKLLRSNRLEELFEEVRQHFGIIVVDMPPMVLAAEAGRVLSMVDKIFFVLQSGSTPRSVIKTNLAYIEEKMGGVVLNQVKPAAPGFFRKLLNL